MDKKWNLYIGVVAEDKFYNSNLAKIYISELLPNFSGDLSDQTVEETININKIKYNQDKNSINVSDNIKTKTSNIITAEYFGLFTNRTFSPDIRKGEQVLVIQHYDTDIYYWLSLGRDDNLRQLEKHRLAISDSKTKVKTLDEDNTYYIEMDTLHKKSIVIRTSKSDGENFRYLIHIDSIKDTIILEDDDGNFIHLESDVPRIKLRNKNNSFVDINKDDIFINAVRDLRINVGRMTYLKSNSVVIDNDTTIQANSPNINMNSETIVLDSPAVGFSGSTKTMGTAIANANRSGSYGTGTPGSNYPKSDVNSDINTASVKVNNGSPDTDDSTGAQRHAAAYEQVKQALHYIADCMDMLGCGNSETVRSLADDSIMSLNKGE